MLKQMMPALRATLLLTIVTGLLYPGAVTLACQVLFADQAKGSLLMRDGHIVGSSLIGQNFSNPKYFWSRPSAAGDKGYDASASSGSNLGPTNQKLADRVKAAAAQFRKDNPDFSGPIPADMLTTSASGLDPHISPASAEAQVARVAKARGIDANRVRALVEANTEGRTFGFMGEPHVNVLKLNLALDKQ